MTQNPLSKFFRQPKLYLKLPSRGRWWPADSLEMPPNQELPVYALTAADEILLKTPDALMNGQSTVDIIQSCLPNIKNAWEMPLTDLDSILISIRQATYGNQMDFTSVCPHCQSKNDHAVDLSVIIDRIKCPNYENTIKLSDMEIYLQPHKFKDFNDQSMQFYEQQRLLAITADDKISQEDKIMSFNIQFRKLVKLSVKSITKNVSAIKLSDGTTIDNPEFIDEFFENCDKDIWNAVKSVLEDISNELVKHKTFNLTCENPECKKDYLNPLEFENSHFFD